LAVFKKEKCHWIGPNKELALWNATSTQGLPLLQADGTFGYDFVLITASTLTRSTEDWQGGNIEIASQLHLSLSLENRGDFEQSLKRDQPSSCHADTYLKLKHMTSIPTKNSVMTQNDSIYEEINRRPKERANRKCHILKNAQVASTEEIEKAL
jgi:hypothetical protein